jgi:chromate transporter
LWTHCPTMSPDSFHETPAASRPASLLELTLLFLKLGVTAFGGPAVHISMMEDEVVARRTWLTRTEFLDFLGATNLIPGPNSTELAIHVGRVRAGWRGLLVAGISFILPAALMVGVLAWAYVRFGALPQVASVLYGVKPVVIAVILQGALRLGKSAVKSIGLGVLGGLALVAADLGLDPLLILALSGALASLKRGRLSGNWIAGAVVYAGGMLAGAIPFSLTLLFLMMLKIGATMFGGGYVLVAFLGSDFVARLGWLSERQLLDAVAVGQVTPGPLFTTATFIGYVLGGVTGAVIATVGIFLPAFLLVAASGPLVPRLRKSPTAAAALDGIHVAALALMVAVSAQLAHTAIVDWLTLGIAALSAVLLLRYRVNSAWLILGSAALGLLLLVSGAAHHPGTGEPVSGSRAFVVFLAKRAIDSHPNPQRRQKKYAGGTEVILGRGSVLRYCE